MTVALPHNEAKHLVALRRYDIMDTMAEQAYDDVTRLAPNACTRPRPQLDLHRPATASIGAATVTTIHADSAKSVEAADEALYEAKAGGRNRVVHIDCG